MSDKIELARADMQFMHKLAGHPKMVIHDYISPQLARDSLGYWAHLPIAQWVLHAKLYGNLEVGDGEENFKAACRHAMEVQSRVIAAFNDAAVLTRYIKLV